MTTKAHLGVSAAFLDCYYGRCGCVALDKPAPTVLPGNKLALLECGMKEETGHYSEVWSFLRDFKIIRPEEEAEVLIYGIRMRLNDIGLRMMGSRELFIANGFPLSYKIDPPL